VYKQAKIDLLIEHITANLTRIVEDVKTPLGSIVHKTGLITLILIVGVIVIGICCGFIILTCKLLKCLFILPAKRKRNRRKQNTHTSLSELDYRLPYPYDPEPNEISRL